MKKRSLKNSGRKCQYCQEELEGRSDKKFCDDYCRTTFNYEKYKKSPSLYMKVNKQLQLNRKLLAYFNKGGKVSVRKEILIQKGFDPHFFTHYWKNAYGEIYLFCYEHGFLKIRQHGKAKYVLILWQDYMKASNGIH
jgi:hypothetical protein